MVKVSNLTKKGKKYQIYFSLVATISSHQRCSIKKLFLKIRNIHWETPVFESIFNIMVTPTHVFSERKICEIFKNTYFEEHLRVTASGYEKKCNLIVAPFFKYLKHPY